MTNGLVRWSFFEDWENAGCSKLSKPRYNKTVTPSTKTLSLQRWCWLQETQPWLNPSPKSSAEENNGRAVDTWHKQLSGQTHSVTAWRQAPQHLRSLSGGRGNNSLSRIPNWWVAMQMPNALTALLMPPVILTELRGNQNCLPTWESSELTTEPSSEWVSRVQRTSRHIIDHFGDESFQAITCTGINNQ